MNATDLGNALAPVNAVLNTMSAVLLIVGYVAIKQKKTVLHKRCMLGAFIASAVFLAGYLTRFYLTGSHRFPDVGILRGIYLVVLFSHMILAIVALPMVLWTLRLGLVNRIQEHRRIAKKTFPIWLYVSATGVLVYLMLYHLAPLFV